MATAAEIVEQGGGTDLIVAEAAQNAVALFTDPKRYSEFYERVRDEVSGHEADLATDKGRKAVAALAFRVTKAKTTLDKAGLALTEGWRQQTAAVNAARKKMTTELDQLADEVRMPLTQWEAREKQRQEIVDQAITRFRALTAIGEDDTAAAVEQRGRELHTETLDPTFYLDRLDEAEAARAAAVTALAQAMHRLRKEEADRAELERLRAAERERAEREEADRLAAEVRRDEETREKQRREAAERAERERQEAIDRAAVNAREAAEAEARRVHDAEIAKEREAADAARREADEVRRKEQERVAWEQEEARKRGEREADQAHRKAVVDEVTADILAAVNMGGMESAARDVANAIAAGTIRHTRISF